MRTTMKWLGGSVFFFALFLYILGSGYWTQYVSDGRPISFSFSGELFLIIKLSSVITVEGKEVSVVVEPDGYYTTAQVDTLTSEGLTVPHIAKNIYSETVTNSSLVYRSGGFTLSAASTSPYTVTIEPLMQTGLLKVMFISFPIMMFGILTTFNWNRHLHWRIKKILNMSLRKNDSW